MSYDNNLIIVSFLVNVQVAVAKTYSKEFS